MLQKGFTSMHHKHTVIIQELSFAASINSYTNINYSYVVHVQFMNTCVSDCFHKNCCKILFSRHASTIHVCEGRLLLQTLSPTLVAVHGSPYPTTPTPRPDIQLKNDSQR